MNPIINISGVEKYYGKKENITKALNNVNIQIYKGEFVGIMGASGSGKTTLLNMISTIDTVSAGHIYFENEDITAMNEKQLAVFRQQNLGFVFQDFNLLDTLTIQENIVLPMAMSGMCKKEIQKRAEAVLSRLGIEETAGKFPYEVSGGQKQRCACARALVMEPKLILADEPTGALDSKASTTLLKTFEQMNTEMNATILMVTHDAFSASYCQRILFLKDGEIFNEIVRGDIDRRTFLNKILDVLALTGGGVGNAE